MPVWFPLRMRIAFEWQRAPAARGASLGGEVLYPSA